MKPTDSDAVVLECELPEPRAKVWRALTEKELLAAWLLPNDIRPANDIEPDHDIEPEHDVEPEHDFRPEVGAKFHLAPGTECEILHVEPGKTLRWRQVEPSDAHRVESVVSFELADLPDGGTRLRVVHDQFRAVAKVLRFPTRAQTVALRMAA